ncbi:hypothetical protein AAC387_Pa05g2373 [Persea americana]
MIGGQKEGKSLSVLLHGEFSVAVKTGKSFHIPTSASVMEGSAGLGVLRTSGKDLDIAIVKATNHAECPPKERYVRRIFASTSVSRPRADVAYCIYTLGRRLAKTRNWTVALKTLIVIHRMLREGDPTFREELLNYSHRGHILQISNFKDDSSPLAWDCSAWVRTYALFLEERLECFRVLKYDIEADRVKNSVPGMAKGNCKTSDLDCNELLEQLPALQQLLYRLIGCRPEGGAFNNYLIQYALALVLKESFKIYCAINDGTINLVDLFFEMPRHDAVKALNVYKRGCQQAESLADFYDFCKGLELSRNFQFPTLRQPPPSFLATMEEYVREAPRIGSVSSKKLEFHEKNLLEYRPEEASASQSAEPTVEADKEQADETQEPEPVVEALPQTEPTADTGDLLGLNEVNPDAVSLEESNALALAIIPSGDASMSSVNGQFSGIEGNTSGWELALVTAPSSNTSHVTESKLAGGFDKLLLESLYEDGEARKQQNVGYGVGMDFNPFDPCDPFSMSNSIAPPLNVQMAMMTQQQQQQYQQHMMPTIMVPYQHQHHLEPQIGGTNPFGDPFVAFSQNAPRGNPSLL